LLNRYQGPGNPLERRPTTEALQNSLGENHRKGSQNVTQRLGSLASERYRRRYAYEDSRHTHRHTYNKFSTGRFSPRKGIRGRYTSQSNGRYYAGDDSRQNFYRYDNSGPYRRTNVNQNDRIESPITSVIQDSRHLQAALQILGDEKRWLTPRDIAILSVEKFLIPFTPDLERLLSQELEFELAQTNSRVSRQNSRFGLRKWI
jgi:hypothetical protein